MTLLKSSKTMVDITTIEPNLIPKPTMVLIEANRKLEENNKQLNYIVVALLFVVLVSTAYIQMNKSRNENDIK
jgi:hypothetical protein